MKDPQIHLRAFLFNLLVLVTLVSCAQKQQEGYKVIGVKDGDTIELLIDKKPVTVRLYGVDAPEKNQPFGTQAKNFASDLAFGKHVQLNDKGQDRYGRTIGEIILPDGRSLNQELVAAGYAWYYKAYANDPKLGYLENDARRVERGLWSQPNPVAPWDFRKNKRDQSNAAANKPIPKPADAGKEVFVCPVGSAATYHVKPDCSVLKRCKGQLEAVTRGHAVMNMRRTACKVCGKKD